jgi:site-specific recombinase XerD
LIDAESTFIIHAAKKSGNKKSRQYAHAAAQLCYTSAGRRHRYQVHKRPGHFEIKTTERYLHVSKKQLVNVTSPFDDLWKKNELEW